MHFLLMWGKFNHDGHEGFHKGHKVILDSKLKNSFNSNAYPFKDTK
jgi:hypothetical protein